MIPFVDIRQSDYWAQYLGKRNWDSHRFSSGANILYKKTFLGTVTKIQRPPMLNSADLTEIEDYCRSIKAMFIKIEPSVNQDMSILKEFGYLKSSAPHLPPSSMYIDLALSEKELWNNISRSGKYSIRRAQREGVIIEYYKNPSIDILEKYYQVVRETGSKKHFYVPPYRDFVHKLEVFGEDCHILLSKDRNGVITGGKMCLCHKNVVLYSTGGTTEAGRKGKSGYELTWKSFLYFKKLGYKVFDLEGVDDDRFSFMTKNWGGFSHFKEKFGGEVIRFPEPQIKYLSFWLNLLSKFSEVPL